MKAVNFDMDLLHDARICPRWGHTPLKMDNSGFFFVSPNFDLKFIILHIKPFQNHFKNENIFSYSNFMADQSFSYIKL